ncbi:unnamed protein product [Ectocarpus sp. 12 AP-2014]
MRLTLHADSKKRPASVIVVRVGAVERERPACFLRDHGGRRGRRGEGNRRRCRQGTPVLALARREGGTLPARAAALPRAFFGLLPAAAVLSLFLCRRRFPASRCPPRRDPFSSRRAPHPWGAPPLLAPPARAAGRPALLPRRGGGAVTLGECGLFLFLLLLFCYLAVVVETAAVAATATAATASACWPAGGQRPVLVEQRQGLYAEVFERQQLLELLHPRDPRPLQPLQPGQHREQLRWLLPRALPFSSVLHLAR